MKCYNVIDKWTLYENVNIIFRTDYMTAESMDSVMPFFFSIGLNLSYIKIISPPSSAATSSQESISQGSRLILLKGAVFSPLFQTSSVCYSKTAEYMNL